MKQRKLVEVKTGTPSQPCQKTCLNPSSHSFKTLATELLPVHSPSVCIIPYAVEMLALGARGELEAAGEQAHLCRGRFPLFVPSYLVFVWFGSYAPD